MKREEKKFFDFHNHTACSDGDQTVSQTLQQAHKEGLDAIALTDHNSFAIYEPMNYEGMKVVPGCEFSASYYTAQGDVKEIHIVGLFFDGVDQDIDEVFEEIYQHAYVKALLSKLTELGIPVTMEELKEAFPETKCFGRTRVAQLVVQKGYAKNTTEVFDRWIGNYSPYYINPMKYMNYLSMQTCVEIIFAYGGFPILAHPFHYHMTDDEVEKLIRDFRKISDLHMGLEVYYQKYTEKNHAAVAYLENMAEKYKLYPSAASDRHKASAPFMKGDFALAKDIKKAYDQNRKELEE